MVAFITVTNIYREAALPMAGTAIRTSGKAKLKMGACQHQGQCEKRFHIRWLPLNNCLKQVTTVLIAIQKAFIFGFPSLMAILRVEVVEAAK